jgi:hypothetical protein
MVLLVGILIPENLRIRRSRILRAPQLALALYVQNIVLHLERKLMGIAIGASASVGQPLNAAFLVAIEDLVARFSGDPKFPAELRLSG